jgi:hypothetical protein
MDRVANDLNENLLAILSLQAKENLLIKLFNKVSTFAVVSMAGTHRFRRCW